jgi:3-deoxy-D-manno-octulosonic-acid transferase
MKKVMRAGGPINWAHASTPAALDAMLEVLLRAQMIEPSLSYVLSALASEHIFDSEVARLQEVNLQSGQDFLSKMLPDLCLWADDNISIPLFELIQRFSIQIILVNAKTRKLRGRTWLWRKTVARQALRPVSYAFVETGESSGHLRSLGLPARNI